MIFLNTLACPAQNRLKFLGRKPINILKMKIIPLVLALVSTQVFAGGVATPVVPKTPTTVIARMDQAQLLFNERANLEKGKEAIGLWEDVLKEDAKNYEALWKLAKAYYWLGNHSLEKEQLDLFTKGKDYGERAVKLYPDNWEGHYWLGVCLGRYGETRGIIKNLFLVKPIQKEMETVLKINPSHAGAHHVLGVIYRKAPGRPLSVGNKKKALRYAKKAVELDPQSLKYAVGLAEVYLALDKKDDAKKTLEDVLAMPPNLTYGPESLEEKDQAQKLLAHL